MPRRREAERSAPTLLKPGERKPGVPFHPKQHFPQWSLEKAIFEHPTLSVGAQKLWLILARDLWPDGTDRSTVKELEEKAVKSRRTIQYNLRELEHAGLVGEQTENGLRRIRLLFYQDIFKKCPPRAPVEKHLTPVQEIAPPPCKKLHPLSLLGSPPSLSTIPVQNVNYELTAVQNDPWPPDPNGTGDHRRQFGPLFYIHQRELFLKTDARNFWKTLNSHEKSNRCDQVRDVAVRLHQAEIWKDDSNPTIAEQNQQLYNQLFLQLSDLGFALTPLRKPNPLQ